MGLSIGLLGPLVIESEESGLGKIPKKARGLLAFLAAQGGRTVSRERAPATQRHRDAGAARGERQPCLVQGSGHLRASNGRGALRAEADDGPISGGADLALTCPAAESTIAVETSLARLRSRIEFWCETVAAALALRLIRRRLVLDLHPSLR